MTTTAFAPETRTCPAWCTDHTGFDDGSENWHQGRTVDMHGFEFYVSTGTISGAPELFMRAYGCQEGMPLEEIREVAEAILTVVKEAQR